MRLPLPKMTNSAPNEANCANCSGPSWSKRVQSQAKRSPREPTTTLPSTFSLLIATQPGPCAVRVWTSDLSGWSFIGALGTVVKL
ncbi:hypothetical protein FQZ97_607060 [compost metagenome]